MGKHLDQYEKIIKSSPQAAAEVLAALCRAKDARIAELKQEIMDIRAAREAV